MHPSLRLSAIQVYPIKACRGLDPAPATWTVSRFGFQYDRRWAVLGPDGECLTQRELPRMALIRPGIEPPHLTVAAPGMPPLILPLEPAGGPGGQARIWGDTVAVWFPDPVADRWLSQFLGMACRLAYLPDQSSRPLDPDYAPDGGETAFADGFPFLLIGQASLDELNRRLARPLPMNRFRPNLVVEGGAPFGEDAWRRIRVGEVEFDVVKPCARCVVTTTDQETAERDVEPLRTLATFRRANGKVLFGQNLVHRGRGTLRLGDAVEVLRAVEAVPE